MVLSQQATSRTYKENDDEEASDEELEEARQRETD